MKELSIEEKAKRYDEAWKVISNVIIRPNHKNFIKL